MNAHRIAIIVLLLVTARSWADRFVSPSGSHIAPFTDWSLAATNIQDAVDAAVAGETVWVTNGVYATGGKVMAGDLTNRVAVDKALTLRSINGPASTVIRGAWDSISTNGPGAVRCVWLTNAATIEGFTITGGATRGVTTSSDPSGSGGGVWGSSSSNSIVMRCVVSSNAACYSGGGCYFVTVRESKILGNMCLGTPIYPAAGRGGGCANTPIYNSLIANNEARGQGGGISTATRHVVNCTIVGNRSPKANFGGGISGVSMTNCIVYFNTQFAAGPEAYLTFSAVNSCSPPISGGAISIGCTSADPQLVDSFHIATTSPCRGTGTNVSTGVDLDGDVFGGPPSIGCDEVVEASLVGPLTVEASAYWSSVPEKGVMQLTGFVNGRASQVRWDFGDGSSLTNGSSIANHSWTNAGDYTVNFTAFNLDNTNGVSTNLSVHVVPLESPIITPGVLSGKTFSVSFPGQPGVTYKVEVTASLEPPIVWQSSGPLIGAGTTIEYFDLTATNMMRFYRVKGP